MPKRYLPLPFLLFALGLAQAQEPSAPASQAAGAESVANAPVDGASEGAITGGAEGAVSGAVEEVPVDESGPKTLSGMSILGNEEAPKSLVIVPWKSSQIGDEVGVANAMDERARPVDKEVFMREVHYYELRSGLREATQ